VIKVSWLTRPLTTTRRRSRRAPFPAAARGPYALFRLPDNGAKPLNARLRTGISTLDRPGEPAGQHGDRFHPEPMAVLEALGERAVRSPEGRWSAARVGRRMTISLRKSGMSTRVWANSPYRNIQPSTSRPSPRKNAAALSVICDVNADVAEASYLGGRIRQDGA
jgi:hypothetical protein